ncbi:MAG: hypothetical protein ACTSV9_02565 [Candidatus Thorarchaeota archaeon]
MSGSSRKKAQAPSTIEAIRMASASILGVSTSRGNPLGSAIGSGSMMEQNSEAVAMNISSLIFAIRDALKRTEGLELLSLEWNLDRAQGSEVLPEQLSIAGALSNEVSSHVCVLSWEEGIVDPFKIDNHMQRLSKKIADVEAAVVNSNLDYETDGMAILGKFADRLNSVVFVEMMDRQFKGSWDSIQLKSENIDEESVIKLQYRDDFTTLPPGMTMLERTDLRFDSPQLSEIDHIDHFKRRILTPSAIETISSSIANTGRAILAELNAYAYGMEEVDIVRASIAALVRFLGSEHVEIRELDSLKKRTNEFASLLTETVDSFEMVIEKHVGSGLTLSLSEHKSTLNSEIESDETRFDGFKVELAKDLVNHMMESVKREFPIDNKLRAWQLKSTMRYFVAYAKKVFQYFVLDLQQYLIVGATRKAIFDTMQSFRDELSNQEMGPTETMQFYRFFDDLYSQLNAVIGKKAFEGSKQEHPAEFLSVIVSDIRESFEKVDAWSLISFEDVARVVRLEIENNHSTGVSEDGSTLSDTGIALQNLLSDFETLVADVVPDVADHLLSKALVSETIDAVQNEGVDLAEALLSIIEKQSEKPAMWKAEARLWVEDFRVQGTDEKLSTNLMDFLQFIHDKAGRRGTARSIVERIASEANVREQEYQILIREWEQECQVIEAENDKIRAHNEKRDALFQQAQSQFNEETAQYESIREKRRLAQASLDSTGVIIPDKPNPPRSMESRIADIDAEYSPALSENPIPPKPELSQEMSLYVELRDTMTQNVSMMNEYQEKMEIIFLERLKQLQSDGLTATETISLGIGDELLEYLMGSVIRGLSRLLPRPTRAYLRNPDSPDIIYVVTYERKGSELTVRIGESKMGGAV